MPPVAIDQANATVYTDNARMLRKWVVSRTGPGTVTNMGVTFGVGTPGRGGVPMVFDTVRKRLVVIGNSRTTFAETNNFVSKFWNTSGGAIQPFTLRDSGDGSLAKVTGTIFESSLLYIPPFAGGGDYYLFYGRYSGIAFTTPIRPIKIDPVTGVTSFLTLAGTAPPDGNKGTENRFIYDPAFKCVYYVSYAGNSLTRDFSVYVFRLG